VRRQDRIGRFLEEFAVGDASCPIQLPRLMPAWDEAEVGCSRTRSREPSDVIDGVGERGGGLHCDAGMLIRTGEAMLIALS